LPTAWRIVKTKFVSSAFDGEGARIAGGRWTSAGRRAVYTSGTIALATLEILTHLDSVVPLPDYSLIELQIPPQLVIAIPIASLPSDWRTYPAPAALLAIGDKWLDDATSAVLQVPSALTLEDNYIINPAHTDFRRITRAEPIAYPLDQRLL
jgi:RES domain-containing protein